MARRFSRFRGPRFRTRPKKRWAWDTTLWNTGMDNTGSGSVFQEIFNPSLALGGGSVGTAQTSTYINVRRVIFDGGLVVLPLNTTFTQAECHLVYGLISGDVDDTDIEFNTTAVGTLLQGGTERLLHVGSIPFSAVESTGSAQNQFSIRPSFKIEFDLKCNVKMRYDHRLWTVFQYQSDITGATSGSTVKGISRVLYSW